MAKLPKYQAITVPMLTICGRKEVRDMKTRVIYFSEEFQSG